MSGGQREGEEAEKKINRSAPLRHFSTSVRINLHAEQFCSAVSPQLWEGEGDSDNNCQRLEESGLAGDKNLNKSEKNIHSLTLFWSQF